MYNHKRVVFRNHLFGRDTNDDNSQAKTGLFYDDEFLAFLQFLDNRYDHDLKWWFHLPIILSSVFLVLFFLFVLLGYLGYLGINPIHVLLLILGAITFQCINDAILVFKFCRQSNKDKYFSLPRNIKIASMFIWIFSMLTLILVICKLDNLLSTNVSWTLTLIPIYIAIGVMAFHQILYIKLKARITPKFDSDNSASSSHIKNIIDFIQYCRNKINYEYFIASMYAISLIPCLILVFHQLEDSNNYLIELSPFLLFSLVVPYLLSTPFGLQRLPLKLQEFTNDDISCQLIAFKGFDKLILIFSAFSFPFIMLFSNHIVIVSWYLGLSVLFAIFRIASKVWAYSQVMYESLEVAS
jgi:hypothetical protein